jgi:hypothetical protein
MVGGRVVRLSRKGLVLLLTIGLIAAVMTISLPPREATATTLEPLTIEQLTERATVVVVAETTGVRTESKASPQGVANGFSIHTVADLRVTKVLKGQSPSARKVVTPGGRVGRKVVEVALMPEFAVGETSVLFLDEQGRVIGGAQGKLEVKDGLVAPLV